MILLALASGIGAGCGATRVSRVAIPPSFVQMKQVDGTFFVLRGVPGEQEMVVVDTTDPARARVDRQIPLRGHAVDFVTSSEHLFLASNEPKAMLRILDWKTGEEIGRYEPASRGRAIRVVSGGFGKTIRLRTENPDGSQVESTLDIDQPKNPKLLAEREVMPLGDSSNSSPGGEVRRTNGAVAPPLTKLDVFATLPELASRFAGNSRLLDMERSQRDPRITVLVLDGAKSEIVLVRDLAHPLDARDSNGDGTVQLACLGDSNTTNNITRSPISWCSAVSDSIWNHRFKVWNYSSLGASLTQGLLPGTEQWEKATEAGADVLILAFGTNDLRAGHRPEEIVAEYRKFSSKARELGVQMYVATTPPLYREDHPGFGQVDRLNQLIQESFPPDQVLDFHSGFGPEYFLDGIHITPEGHQLRGERVANRLLDRKAP